MKGERQNPCLRGGERVERRRAWAEDTALLGSKRSADPGGQDRKAGDGFVPRRSVSYPFGIGTQAKNPAGRSLASWTKKTPGDGLPVVANSVQRELHFTLNQYSSA